MAGPHAGSITITIGGHKFGTVNLHRTASNRLTVWLTGDRSFTGTLTIKAKGSATLDGVLIGR
jgi:hypothetical protein